VTIRCSWASASRGRCPAGVAECGNCDTSVGQFGNDRGQFHVKPLVAEATAREIGRVSLAEALELTVLIARDDPRRHPRVAARWLSRYLEERAGATIDEAGIAAACLAALGRDGDEQAVQTLRAMARATTAEGASRRSLTRGPGRTAAPGRSARRPACYPFRPRLTTRLTLLPFGSTAPNVGCCETTRPLLTLFE
jgi:hypothetical protein